MSDPFEIPAHQLPPGFAERIEEPAVEPAPAHPAATAVLLRDSEAGPETLLLRRHRASGFVPGAYVFPGGRVDDADADPTLLGRATGLPSGGAPRRGPALATGAVHRGAAGGAPPPEPPPAYWIAAAREVFEETGILLAVDAAGRPAPDAAGDRRMRDWREALLSEQALLLELLEAESLVLDFSRTLYAAHWITPVAEPRRYDTRFFLAAVPPEREALPDPREMTDALWAEPAAALERFGAGALPMVFPTVKMLERLTGFRDVAAALDAFRGAEVRPVLPRLVRTETGVRIVVEDDSSAEGSE